MFFVAAYFGFVFVSSRADDRIKQCGSTSDIYDGWNQYVRQVSVKENLIYKV